MNTRDKILTVLVAISGLLNIALAAELISLERVVHPVARVRVGAHLADVVGTDPRGLPETIRFADSQNPTVLLILKPGCEWCAKNMPNWQTLTAKKAQSFRFVAVSLSPIGFTSYLEKERLTVLGVALSRPGNPELDKLTAPPQTIVVSPEELFAECGWEPTRRM